MTTRKYNVEEAMFAVLQSSEEDEDDDIASASELDSFDSSEEELFANKTFEDGEPSQPPPPPAKRPCVARRPPPPAKRPRVARLPAKRQRVARQPPRPAKRLHAARRLPQARPGKTAPQPPAPTSWKTEEDLDTAPPVLRFQPTRTPGPQVSATATPVELFKLFFSQQTVQTLCQNTNKRAAREIANGKKYKWIDLTVDFLYKYIGLLFYMSLVKLASIEEYWVKNHLCSVPLPAKVMSRDRFCSISWNVHLSDPDQDVHNDCKRGTAEHDKLFQVKPLMDTIKTACKAFYHPHRELAVDERMVASRANSGFGQFMKDKPTKWGFKLFVLADSRNGYTMDFSIYTDKSVIASIHGVYYDIVMVLVRPRYLGTGYHIFMDNFYSSPTFFRALHECRFAACGTYRDYRKECPPRPNVNALTKKSARGSMRWIRDGRVIFVKWMDTKEVSACSTIHTAHSGKTVERRVKQEDGSWTRAPVPCPTPVAEYNKYMGGVDLSDQLIQYYSAQCKTMRWYRTLFNHFLDIAATNSYIIHKELCLAQQRDPMTHRRFVAQLAADLCGQPLRNTPARAPEGHVAVTLPATAAACPKKKARIGRRVCMLCRKEDLRKDTSWKCEQCDVPLCLSQDRNCFKIWHGTA